RVSRADYDDVFAGKFVRVGELVFDALVFIRFGGLRDVLEAAPLAEFVIAQALLAALVAELRQGHAGGRDDHLQILARDIQFHRRAPIADGQDDAASAGLHALPRLILIR